MEVKTYPDFILDVLTFEPVAADPSKYVLVVKLWPYNYTTMERSPGRTRRSSTTMVASGTAPGAT